MEQGTLFLIAKSILRAHTQKNIKEYRGIGRDSLGRAALCFAAGSEWWGTKKNGAAAERESVSFY